MRQRVFVVSMLLSGAAALIYEIVWLRRLGPLLGQDVYAITVVLTVFFAGLGVGGWLFGRIADRLGGRIGLYVALELLVAVSALAFDPALSLLDRVYTRWSPAELSWQASLAVKGLAGFAILVIPTLAMGGTLPAMSRHVLRREHQVTSGFGWLYGANTLGAAGGVLIATFLLIPRLGVGMTMRSAVFMNLAAAGVAWWGARWASTDDTADEPKRRHGRRSGSDRPTQVGSGSRVPLLIAFCTGFVSVGFEVLWTRGLSTRFVSGVYSLAVILGVYLLCIAMGAFLVAMLDRRGWVTATSCGITLVAAGLAGLLSPAMIARTPFTSDRIYEGVGTSFLGFESAQFAWSLAVMAASLLMFGLALPMVVRLATRDVGRIGASTGSIYFVNSMGAVAAPLVVGFGLMPALGLGPSFVLLGGLLAAVGAFVVLPWAMRDGKRVAVAAAFIVPAVGVGAAAALRPDIRAWRSHPDAVLVDYREGIAASVSVVDHPERGRVLQVNLGYTLGGSRGVFAQRRQGLWPFLLQRDAESALILGLGTGCTAAAAYEQPGVRLDALEIVPDLFPMLAYYEKENFSLVDRADHDERLRLLSVDARHFVRSTHRRYDVVIGDLFEPWRQGVGTMYTRDHFEAVARLLTERGTFWQWLPLYQLAGRELKTIARTFCAAFDHVEVWWLEFNAEYPAVAFVGTRRARTLGADDVGWVFASGEPPPVWIDAGFLGPGPALGSWICGRETLMEFAGPGPLNTQDHPLIEFNAPRSLVDRASGWGAQNMHRMFVLTDRAGDERAAIFPDDVTRGTVERYTAAVRRMMIANEQQNLGKMDQAIEAAIEASQHTPEWSYPISYCNLLLDQGLAGHHEQFVNHAIARLAAEPRVAFWADYWRGRRALRDGRPFVAQSHLRKALEANPNHSQSANLLAELERRFGRPVDPQR